MVIYILDLDVATHRTTDTNNQKIWKWNPPGIKKLAILYEPSLNNLHVRISTHIQNGRKVGEIIEALDNAGPNNNLPAPADTSNITSDNDLDAFLRLTEAKPIKLLVRLHNLAGLNSPTPPGSGSNYYFPLGRFDGL